MSAIAAALLLSGCSQVGAAASIGDTKITQEVVQTSIDSILAERAKIDISQMELQTGADLNLSHLRIGVVVSHMESEYLLHHFAKILKSKGALWVSNWVMVRIPRKEFN